MTSPNLLSIQRESLIKLARSPSHPLFGTRNQELDDRIQQLKEERPEAFHAEQSLHDRIFVHAPRQDAVRVRMPYKHAMRQQLSATEMAERTRAITRQMINAERTEDHASTHAND